MRNVLVALGASAFVIAFSACTGADPALGDPPPPPADPTCPADCIPKAPLGWNGPAAVARGPTKTLPSSCERELSVEVIASSSDIAFDPVVCNECKTIPTDARCEVQAAVYTDAACTTPTATSPHKFTITKTDQPCLSTAQYGKSLKVAQATPKATCPHAVPAPPTRPAPVWKNGLRACAPPSLGACGTRDDCTGTIVAEAPFEGTCIFAPGEQSCPAEYPYKQPTTYRAFEDKRGCDECLDEYKGTCDENLVVWHDNTTCSGAASGSTGVGPGGCGNIDATGTPTIMSVKLQFTIGNEICGGYVPQPNGEVVPSDPVTVCCLAPVE